MGRLSFNLYIFVSNLKLCFVMMLKRFTMLSTSPVVRSRVSNIGLWFSRFLINFNVSFTFTQKIEKFIEKIIQLVMTSSRFCYSLTRLLDKKINELVNNHHAVLIDFNLFFVNCLRCLNIHIIYHI